MNPAELCGKCGLRRDSGTHANCNCDRRSGIAHHAFVEPVPAPQPPADAATNESGPAELGPPIAPGHEWINGSLRRPAGPPVTGDGDETVVREIANRWTKEWSGSEGRTRMPGPDAIANAVREAIARGRALGARDERADIIRDARESHCFCCPGQPRCPICEFADAIARRAGRGT
jgi:hypothetical protein